jgi:HK97 family phage portal protein
MALVRRIQAAAPTGANPFTSILREPFFGARTHSGKTVTVDTALMFDAVWACIRLRANTTSQMPIRVFERLGGDDFQPATGTGADQQAIRQTMKLLRKPNAEHVRANSFNLLSAHINGPGDGYWGKSFARIAGRDIVTEVWPIPPSCVEPFREGGVKYFWVKDLDTGRRYPDPFTTREILHFMPFSMDGIKGLSRIGYARETIGAGLAMDHFLNVFWRNSGVPPLVLTSDQELTPAARKRMRRDWRRVQEGFRNAWRTAILEQGTKAEPLSLSLPDAEFVATGQHSVQKICRWFGLQPSMIGAASSDSMTYKNLEGEALRFLMFTMNAEWTLIEQTLEGDPDLFPIRPGDVEPRFFPQFDRSKFLQVDPLTEAKVFSVSTGGRAWQKPSEIRKVKHLPPDPSLDDIVQNPPGQTPSVGSGG